MEQCQWRQGAEGATSTRYSLNVSQNSFESLTILCSRRGPASRNSGVLGAGSTLRPTMARLGQDNAGSPGAHFFGGPHAAG